MLFGRSKYLQLRRSDESKHFVAVGDTGVGKSTLIRQILHYAERCGDMCVVLDSKLEFIPEFFDPRRGDKILSPKDNRTIWWDLANEVGDEADALMVTRSLYPPAPGNYQGKWFDDQACKIAAYLLTNSDPRPTCEQFGHWLTDPISEIYPRLLGSEHEHTLDRNAANQKAGVLGTLNQVGTALRMMPRDSEREHREVFTIRRWAQTPRGWLFLPNTAETRDALKPLQSGWVDMCIARVMSSEQGARRVWIVLDELDSLGTLSKLQDGMTQLRSTGHPMVLGVQNFSQLEDRYGKQASTIFSQAYSKVIFAVSESKSAKDLQDLFGEVEIQRFRESRTGSLFGGKDRTNFSGPEEIRKPVFLASEIQGLPDLTGYFAQRPADDQVGLHIVKVKLPYEKPVWRDRPLIPREIPRVKKPAPPPATGAQLTPYSCTLNPEAARPAVPTTITTVKAAVPSSLTWNGYTIPEAANAKLKPRPEPKKKTADKPEKPAQKAITE